MFGFIKKMLGQTPEPATPAEPDHATFYISDPALVGTRMLERIEGVKSYEGLSDSDRATGMLVRFKDGEMRMTFMPEHMMEEHLAGLCGYVEQTIPDRENLPYVLSRIRNVKMVIGCVITPCFDEDDVMFTAVMNLNCELNGLLMLGDSLFDRDAKPIAGSACSEC
jgi:hypothetical protein